MNRTFEQNFTLPPFKVIKSDRDRRDLMCDHNHYDISGYSLAVIPVSEIGQNGDIGRKTHKENYLISGVFKHPSTSCKYDLEGRRHIFTNTSRGLSALSGS